MVLNHLRTHWSLDFPSQRLISVLLGSKNTDTFRAIKLEIEGLLTQIHPLLVDGPLDLAILRGVEGKEQPGHVSGLARCLFSPHAKAAFTAPTSKWQVKLTS